MTARARLFLSPRADLRLAEAADWLAACPPHADVLVLGQTLHAPLDLLTSDLPTGAAVLGRRRTTLRLLATELAAVGLARAGRVPAGAVARDALVARALSEPGDLGRFGRVADTPGFVRSLAGALDELWLAGRTAADLMDRDPDLAALGARVEAEWDAAGLASLAARFAAATATARDPACRHETLEWPLLLLDVKVHSWREAEFVRALADRSPATLVTIAARDARTRGLLSGGAFGPPEEGPTPGGFRALDRLARHLFVSAPDPSPADGSVAVFSAPGEGRECVEIARRLLDLARSGTPFDRCAILLRQPADYRPYVAEAMARAEVPAYFARGVRRPDPAGRAFLALLRCRAEGYSALRFSEYLSLGQVPELDAAGVPVEAPSAEARWRPPDPEVAAVPRPLAGSTAEVGAGTDPDEAVRDAAEDAVGGGLPTPRRWEKLLVESSVVGDLERWPRRLDGLREQLELARSGLEVEDADQPGVRRLERQIEDLAHLRAYALPLIRALADLPERAGWGDWLDQLGELAARWLRAPAGVLATLDALEPMRPLGPVPLGEVLRALRPRLLEVTEQPVGNRYGRVFVGAIDEARGMSFDVVFIPGLAERVFPPKIAEDPILLDAVRTVLDEPAGEPRPGRVAPPRPLVTNQDRVAEERLWLALAVGAAREAVVLSYARIEANTARPRVPSFYALEAVRAAEGSLPQFEGLAKRAEEGAAARIGWPAPRDAGRAIDEAEYDLAVLDDLGLRGDEAVRAAGHLLNTNPHLARALRFRAYRWEVPRWTWADGLVDLRAGARRALARQAPDSRAFSATALQHFAACPYRFYLQALMRLAPRESPVGIEELDPLERGSLFHQAQFELFKRLQGEGTSGDSLLPVRPENLDRVLEILDEVLHAVAADFEDRLVPAIQRVWDDSVERIRQDLRQWLYRESREEGPFRPWRFELAFGLPPDPDRDARSVLEPVELENGLTLRGAIDLIERSDGGVLRVTDHKTGRARARRGAVIQGGELLQPVLYGLAASRLFPEASVGSGRLYYCTADGNFATHDVPLDGAARDAAALVAEVVDGAFEGGLFPALPRSGACRWCDYLSVCGPDEERRVGRKPSSRGLDRLREAP